MTLRFAALPTLVLVATLAAASERAEIPLARGLIEFNAGHYAQALEQFDAALRTEPGKVSARYYRGITRGKLGDWNGAVEDLGAVLVAHPELARARLELAIALLHQGAYADAIPLLEQAAQDPTLAAEANLALGRAQLAAKQLVAARESLSRAAASDELRPQARFFHGVASYRLHAWDDAQSDFADVQAATPQSEIGQQAATYLRRLRPYEAHASLAFVYDSNVTLAPSNSQAGAALGVTGEADGSAVLQAGGSYTPWRTAHMQLALGYDFSQSLQFRLTQFNLQDHQPYLALAFDAEVAQLGLLTSYDYSLLETHSFFQQPLTLPWVTIPEGDLGRTDFFYSFRYRDFYAAPFAGVRNGYNHATGATQYLYLGAAERYLSLTYRFDTEIPQYSSGLPFGYDGNEVGAGAGWALPADISGETRYAYRHEAYRAQSLGRGDNESLVTAALRKQMTEDWGLHLTFLADINNSSQAVYEYQRYVVSLALEARF